MEHPPTSPFTASVSPSDRAARLPRRPSGFRFKAARALTLVEVVFAMGLLTMISLGVLQAMLQSRRMSEGSVRQASIASLVQGYMEQFKSIKFAADSSNKLPSSPPSSFTGADEDDWEEYDGGDPDNPTAAPVILAKDGGQVSILFYLVPGDAPTSIPDTSTLPTGPAKHTEEVDIDNADSDRDNSTLDMWVWVNDLTDGTRPNVVNCKAIVVVYQWTVRDGGRVRTYRDMTRTVRSIVPTT